MRADDPNLEYLLLIADALGHLREEIDFANDSVATLSSKDSVDDPFDTFAEWGSEADRNAYCNL